MNQPADKILIRFSKQDIEDLIATLRGYELGERKGNTLSWEAHMIRRERIAANLTELLKKTFYGAPFDALKALVPELDGCFPVVLYLESDAARQELIAAMKKAKPDMVTRDL